jgi:hypothetical protein
MEELLSNITYHITKYKGLGDKLVFDDTATLNVLMKDLSSDLFYLEKYRDSYARRFNSILNSHIAEGMAVSKADIIAKERVPELYMLRRIMTSAYKVLDAIRSNQSFLKNEK